jgi:uncharacterized caspase-like protein
MDLLRAAPPGDRRGRRRLLGAMAATIAGAATGAQPLRALASRDQERIALVIGNSAYRVAPLKNPVNDAKAVAARLRGLGYAVGLHENTSMRELIESLREFSLRATQAQVRMLFYAGHGVQLRGRNYLLPIDADPRTEDDIARQGADVGAFVERLSAIPHGINVVVLDACRVNPFAGGVIVGPDGRRLKFRGSTPPGLAPLDAPTGTMIAFSTSPNGVALDNPDGAHSVYTKHLLGHLDTPGLPIEQLFKRVRVGVAADTARVQVPWESSSLTADFCFRPSAQGHCG